jgi:hypothetical protein
VELGQGLRSPSGRSSASFRAGLTDLSVNEELTRVGTGSPPDAIISRTMGLSFVGCLMGSVAVSFSLRLASAV